MRTHHRTSIGSLLAAAVVLAAGASGGTAAAAAAATAPPSGLPPELVAGLEADRAAANRALAATRTRLAAAAAAQRTVAAANARSHAFATAVRDVAAVAPLPLPPGFAASLTAVETSHAAQLKARQTALDAATERAADAQAAALDADRRIRALQRATATEDDRDTTLGSWRFGSGGPPVSAATLDDYLASKGSPLAGEGAAFLGAGVEHEIDPRLLVAIAGAESYFGVVTCAPHNAWGWGCPSGPFAFKSWAHAIDTVALGLRENYLDDGLSTVGEIHLRYAPPDAANDPDDLNYGWADNVARFLVEQGGDPQDIDGVLGPSR